MSRKLTQEQVIKQFKEVHGDLYDYSKVLYKSNQTSITVICKTHGEFITKPYRHKQGKNCIKCANLKPRSIIINQFKEVHGDLYNYSKFDFSLGQKSKSIIICPIHGEFKQTASVHKNGSGCPECSRKTNKGRKHLTQDVVIGRFKEVHGDLYSYDKFKYTYYHEKGIITCRIHGDFEQAPYNHAGGSGCSKCRTNFSEYFNVPSYLYYLKIITKEGHVYYKIGVTSKEVEERVYAIWNTKKIKNISILHKEYFTKGLNAYIKEMLIKNSFAMYRAKDVNVLVSGNTELFSINCYLH